MFACLYIKKKKNLKYFTGIIIINIYLWMINDCGVRIVRTIRERRTVLGKRIFVMFTSQSIKSMLAVDWDFLLLDQTVLKPRIIDLKYELLRRSFVSIIIYYYIYYLNEHESIRNSNVSRDSNQTRRRLVWLFDALA